MEITLATDGRMQFTKGSIIFQSQGKNKEIYPGDTGEPMRSNGVII